MILNEYLDPLPQRQPRGEGVMPLRAPGLQHPALNHTFSPLLDFNYVATEDREEKDVRCINFVNGLLHEEGRVEIL